MRLRLFCSALLLTACTEAPRPQPQQPIPDAPDMASPAAADLTGVTNPNVDLATAGLTLTGVAPRLASTLGRERVTLTGTGFDKSTEVTFGGVPADIESVTPTSIVAFTPAGLPWGVPTVIAVRRISDGARVVNGTTNNSPTGFRFYASVIRFDWAARINPESRQNPRVPLVGDLNGDNRPDIIATFISDARYNTMLNNGAGDFLWLGNTSEITTPNNPGTQKGILTDLNGDKLLDLVVADEGNTWDYNLGNGTGKMNQLGNQGYNGAGGACSGLNSPVAIFLSNANYPDIAVACNNQSNVRIWNNQFNGGNAGSIFGGQNAGNQVTISVASNPRHLMVADINNDGKQDLVVMSTANGGTVLSWFINQGTTLPATPTGTVGTNNQNQQPYWGICRDINNDNFPDCLVSDQNTASVRIFMNNAGVLQPPANVDGTVAVGANPREVNLEDVNGDGQLDLLVASYDNSTTNIIPGRGNGTFGNLVGADGRVLSQRAIIATPGCRYSWSVRAADFDGDGDMDLVTNCEQNERGEPSFGGFHIFRNFSY